MDDTCVTTPGREVLITSDNSSCRVCRDSVIYMPTMTTGLTATQFQMSVV